MQRLFSALHVFWYKLLGGRLVGRIQKAPVLLLTTVGRKTGKERELPLLYFEDGANVYVIASNGGRPQHPAWYLNLTADPKVKVRMGGNERPMVARTASPEEREQLWPKAAAKYSGYDKYVKKTDRKIPVVILSPA
jgi:deazaflavin-dependent oxidoreductase (nitroreductase family)